MARFGGYKQANSNVVVGVENHSVDPTNRTKVVTPTGTFSYCQVEINASFAGGPSNDYFAYQTPETMMIYSRLDPTSTPTIPPGALIYNRYVSFYVPYGQSISFSVQGVTCFISIKKYS